MYEIEMLIARAYLNPPINLLKWVLGFGPVEDLFRANLTNETQNQAAHTARLLPPWRIAKAVQIVLRIPS